MSARLHIWSVDHLLVCVPTSLPDGLVERLRTVLAIEPSVDGVLDALTADGLTSTPPFVCAATGPAGVRVVIRGELEAVAHGSDGSALTLGAGRAATWNDDVVTDIAAISIGHDDGGTFTWIPPRPAVVPAPAHIEPEPEPEPEREPEPEPVATAPVVAAPAESHTLDEQAFQRLVGVDEALDVEPPGPPASPFPAPPHPDAGPDPASSDPLPGSPPPATDDALDFSSLLDNTSHAAPAPPRPAPPGVPAPPVPSPPPPPGPPVPFPPAPPPPPTPTPTSASGSPLSAPPITAVPPTGTGLGEHDGRTVTLADLRRLQEQADPTVVTAVTAPETPAPGARPGEVRAVRCPDGHANPPTAVACRLCGRDIADPGVVVVPRPVIARLVFGSGLIVDVDRPQVIGRRPTTPAAADEIPNLVTIPSPDSDISRAHTVVRVEGWDLLVEDVGSTNGTEVRLPGREPVRLREHDPVLVVEGTEVTMAGVVRFRVEAPEA